MVEREMPLKPLHNRRTIRRELGIFQHIEATAHSSGIPDSPCQKFTVLDAMQNFQSAESAGVDLRILQSLVRILLSSGDTDENVVSTRGS